MTRPAKRSAVPGALFPSVVQVKGNLPTRGTGYTRSTDTQSYVSGNSFKCERTTGRKYWFRAVGLHPSALPRRTVT